MQSTPRIRHCSCHCCIIYCCCCYVVAADADAVVNWSFTRESSFTRIPIRVPERLWWCVPCVQLVSVLIRLYPRYCTNIHTHSHTLFLSHKHPHTHSGPQCPVHVFVWCVVWTVFCAANVINLSICMLYVSISSLGCRSNPNYRVYHLRVMVFSKAIQGFVATSVMRLDIEQVIHEHFCPVLCRRLWLSEHLVVGSITVYHCLHVVCV